MRALTAFLVGVGTVTVAIAGGLGGGLLIADAMNPKAKTGADTAQFRRSESLPTFKPVDHVGASLAFIDSAVDGSARTGAREAHSAAAAQVAPAPLPARTTAAVTSEIPEEASKEASRVTLKETSEDQGKGQGKNQAAKEDETARPAEPAPKEPAATQSASSGPQAPNAKPEPNPADAYAKAHDADVRKSAAEKHRITRTQQRWADRHRRDQRDQDQANSDQQPGDDGSARGDDGPRGFRYGDRSDGGRGYPDSYARRYRDDSRPRYRDADRYYWGQDEWRNRDDAPRAYDLPEVQLLAPE